MTSQLIDRIDQRTRLAGHNRLALLLFRLGGRQLFGVNVFKVQEVLRRPPVYPLPGSAGPLLGVADVRGRSIPVLDLGSAIAHPEADAAACEFLVVAEFNRSVQGFLVAAVDRIVNVPVEELRSPPDYGGPPLLTAVTRVGGELVQLIDVEKVLADVAGVSIEISSVLVERAVRPGAARVLVVDDSRVARAQIRTMLQQLGAECVLLPDGRQALAHLKELAQRGIVPSEYYALVVSDIEMPEMDGYTLTTEIRRDPALAGCWVLLHTSLSGVFNNAMVERVGANAFVPKYSPDELAECVLSRFASLGIA
ncbi:chemotaxis protein [Tahibacter soli]|uniref:Chemotaxis protein n=1 Tax=Tahibacter soli TaxID=2983605 RepID=A0A9X3YKV7_9GAMM|nr:chemotaxis protein [Tahibacter soli]MDC8012841.1 chemotaxis protein [Tahibacter soli]